MGCLVKFQIIVQLNNNITISLAVSFLFTSSHKHILTFKVLTDSSSKLIVFSKIHESFNTPWKHYYKRVICVKQRLQI